MTHPSADERVARGKAARAAAPRPGHAGFEPAAGRPDPVDLLESQSATRVPELVPIRYGRMLASPFAFFRGGALLMAADLAGSPVSGIKTQLCGDAHLSNFGLFASPDRHLVFDLNDFDETLPGPWEWDLKRLAASVVVAGRENGLSTGQRRDLVLETVGTYRSSMRSFAGMRNLDVFYARLDADGALDRLSDQVSAQIRKRYEKIVAKARTSDSVKALSKLTAIVNGELRIVSDPPLIQTVEELLPGPDGEAVRASIHDLLRQYRSTLERDRREALEGFRIVDAARRVGGVGSVGTRAWIVLMLGRDEQDPLFLQLKESERSVLEGFLRKSRYRHHGQRVVSGQRLMQASSDIFLGWQRLRFPDGVTRDFYARQLKDWKGSFEVEGARPQGMTIYGRACGWTLARAHARSGDRIAIAEYLGRGDAFDRAIADFAESYADQNERDYRAFADAVKAGRLAVEAGL